MTNNYIPTLFEEESGAPVKSMKNNNFYIAVRVNNSSDYTFKKVKGSKLNSNYFAYKSDISGFGYSITDVNSGVSIKTKLPTLAACKEYLANLSEEEQAKIDEKKKTAKYQEVCKKLADFIMQDNQELEQDFPDPED